MSTLNLIEAFNIAFETMRERKLRTTLTTLGVIIGITAIVALTAIGEGYRSSVVKTFQSLGVDVLTVVPFEATREGGFLTQLKPSEIKLTTRDVSKLEELEIVEKAVPVIVKGAVFVKGREKVTTRVIGVDLQSFFDFYSRIKFEEGSIPPGKSTSAAIFGYYIARKSGEKFIDIGDKVSLVFKGGENSEEKFLRVVGILNKSGFATLIGSLDNQALIPFKTAQRIFRTGKEVSAVLVKVTDTQRVDEAAKAIEDMYGGKVTAFSIKTILDTVNSMLRALEMVLAGIAAVSLFVAGVGIMNTMLISVMERTREIGIMKAIGAKNRDIMSIFLLEACIIGFMGGLTGLVLGYFAANILNVISSGLFFRSPLSQGTVIKPIFPVELFIFSIAFAISVSVIFALYPAYKAARLQPVEALRYE